MEQLSLTAGKEKENVVQILTDLMEHNREFQIMITVPARAAGEENSLEYVQAKEVPKRDLERDVTNMIHDIGVPAQCWLRPALCTALTECAVYMQPVRVTPAYLSSGQIGKDSPCCRTGSKCRRGRSGSLDRRARSPDRYARWR